MSLVQRLNPVANLLKIQRTQEHADFSKSMQSEKYKLQETLQVKHPKFFNIRTVRKL